jgi:DNA repair protein RadD
MRPLHDYQDEAFCDLRTTIKQGARRIMVQSPTGSGKTRLSAEIVDSSLRKGNKVAFVVPAIALIDQTIESFYEEGIRGIGAIQANHPMTDWSQPVQVASVQTLQSRGVFPEANTVIFDEAHRLFEAHKKWLTHPDWQAVPFIGLSATPWAKGLGKYFTTLLKVTSTRELIDRGFLSPFRVFSTGHPDLSGVKLVAGDFHEGQLSTAMQEGTLTADIVKTYQAKWGRGRTLCFAVDQAHARHLQERFEAAGVPAGYQDADTTGDERKEIKRKFHNGEYEVVCNIQTLTTGVDWKVDCLILARPTKSEMLFVQIVGRALRTDPDNPDKVALILDHSDTTTRLGFVTDIDHDELDDGKPRDKAKAVEKKEPLPKECQACTYLMPARSRECPNCAHPVKPECTVFEADGELQEIMPGQLRKVATKKDWSWAEKRVLLAELKGYALDKNYKEGWAAMKYRDKFGVWPDRSMDSVPASEIISPGTLNFIRYRNIAWAKSKANSQAAE